MSTCSKTKIEYIPNGSIRIAESGKSTIIPREQHHELLRLLLTKQNTHTIAKTPPFVLVIKVDYQVDRDQRTPHRTFVMPCRTRRELTMLRAHLICELTEFSGWKLFEVLCPPLPEKDFYPEELAPAPGNPLHYYVPRFFAALCEHEEHWVAVGAKRWNEFALAEWRQMYAVAEDKQSVADRYAEIGGVMELDLTKEFRKKKR
jgi:hypothetical protein